MPSNLDKLKEELNALIKRGERLSDAMQYECRKEQVLEFLKESLKKQKKPHDEKTINEMVKSLPSFNSQYQSWYSAAHAVIKQLLPDRLENFVAMYEKPKGRKTLSYGNYTIADYLQGLRNAYLEVEESAAIPQMTQQLQILKACAERFDSSLFDIKHMVQADLFDSELDAAQELARHKFFRAAGAVAGVVLEKHLKQVCENHGLAAKKNPSISDLNDLLKSKETIDIPQWRAIQHLGDLRNLCDHDKKMEPTPTQVHDLISGVSKVTKTIF